MTASRAHPMPYGLRTVPDNGLYGLFDSHKNAVRDSLRFPDGFLCYLFR